MIWEYSEANPHGARSGGFLTGIEQAGRVLDALPATLRGSATQLDATRFKRTTGVVSTDPPYYDNIGYADLSDFFYVWLRHSSVRSVFPELFITLAVPKAEELVATPYRHGGRREAEVFFLHGMSQAIRRLRQHTHPAFPVTIYYAFKQAEHRDADTGVVSTGWETFLDAIIGCGFEVTGTWPMRTEYTGNLKKTVSALASSIVLVCRRRRTEAQTATWPDFRETLARELPPALIELQKAGIAPVDLAQAAIGPGMAAYTRYARVLYSSGKKMTVGEALALINEVLAETLQEQEGEFDTDTRWALAWCTQHHFDEADFGIANVLAMAMNISVAGLVEAGILHEGGGRVRLLRPEELPEDWDPATDRRLTVWEMVHHLVRVLEGDGELAAGQLLRRIGGQAEAARDLAYRLYAICDRQKRAAEARVYNSLVTSWPELARIAREDHGRQQRLQ